MVVIIKGCTASRVFVYHCIAVRQYAAEVLKHKYTVPGHDRRTEQYRRRFQDASVAT